MNNTDISLISPEQVVRGQAQLSFPLLTQEGQFWLQHHAEENPLTDLIWIPDSGHGQEAMTLLPEGYGVRSKVHEYGGMPYTLAENQLFWVDEHSQQILTAFLSDSPTTLKASVIKPLTQQKNARYGEPVLHPCAPWLIAIEELHPEPDDLTGQVSADVINQLVAIHINTGRRQVLVTGADFYSSPRFSPDGNQLIWIEWNHPDQPWTSTRLKGIQWQEDLSAVPWQSEQLMAIFPSYHQTSAVQQPGFTDQGEILFISDHEGFWNLYLCQSKYGRRGKSESEAENTDTAALVSSLPVNLYPVQADCASAPWQFGNSHYQLLSRCTKKQNDKPASSEYRLYICVCRQGLWQLDKRIWSEGLTGPSVTEQNCLPEFSSISFLSSASCAMEAGERIKLSFLAASPAISPSVVMLSDHNARISFEYQRRGTELDSVVYPERVRLKLPEHSVYGLFYPCLNNPTAPLMINVHGGPTSCAFPGLQPQIQFWCQQGFSVLDLNHRGSTGFGRAYREQLKHQWGEADLEDARLMAHYLASQGKIDGDNVVIRGQSAGGYCALRAATLGYFTAAVSLYGISDLKLLAQSTHKFESHYLHWLIGHPEHHSMRYQFRSPLLSLREEKQLPDLLLFQGKKDRIVPIDQMTRFAQLYRALGYQCETFVYEDEAHGFRQYGNRLHQLQTELFFYQSRGILPDAKKKKCT
ncbi:S9 family peptidase [Oceanospirillum sediminis]|uniref:S9 family peptidase n=1 Tax=Oceanospirillum sediminis TaxID=2760088 RepID=A0A839IP81_9GAMM|nr:prolyl oligopeptidase family serine peptidase [Oceanospirillum sediminis]MBB1486758.1 S9 family peptidase [Oceanospirillum sediminis]